MLAADRLLTPYRRRDQDVPLAELDHDVVRLTDRDRALDWLEAERVNLVAVIRSAAPDQPLLAWRLADAMWPLFHYRRHHQDRMRVDEIAVSCARRLGDRDREARMLRRWAFAHFDIAEFDRAAELFGRLLQLSEEMGDRYGVASAAEGLGQVALARRRYPDATAFFTRQLRLCRELGQPRRVAMALLNLGTTANESAEPEPALVHLREAAAIFGELAETETDPYNSARTSIELGRTLGRLGEARPARQELCHALTEMRRLGSVRGQAQARHRLGELSLARRDLVEARDQLTEAMRLYRETGDVEAEQVAGLIALIPPAETDPDRVT